MRVLALFLITAMINVAVFAQPLNKDSLEKVLLTMAQDTARVNLLAKLAETYGINDTTKSDALIMQSLHLSKKLKYDNGQLNALRIQASFLRLKGRSEESLQKRLEYIELAESIGDKDKMGVGYLNAGQAYSIVGENEKALEYTLKGAALLENSTNKGFRQDAYFMLQRLYASRDEFEKSVFYGRTALAIAKEMKDAVRTSKAMYNLSFAFNLQKKFDSAAILCKEVINLSKQTGDTRIEGIATYNLASINLRKGNYALALPYAQQALELSRFNKDVEMESNALAALGLCNLLRKDYLKAKEFYEQSIAIKQQLDDQFGLAAVKNSLSNAYFALNEPVKAYLLHLESEDYMEGYNNELLSKQSSDLEKKYETAKKENQIQLQKAELNRKNILNYMLIGGAAALLLILFVSYRSYRNKQKLQQQRISELETAQRLSDTEAVLKGEEQERSRLAKELHDGLGGMLSGIKHSFQHMKGNMVMTIENQEAFDRSLQMLDTSISEMRRVAHNMMPEALVKFGLDAALRDFVSDVNQTGALQISYKSIGIEGKEIDQSVSISIYRIVQELINNIMKHAKAANAIVQLVRFDEHFALTVEDDGEGFDTTILKTAKGIGWTNIQNRVSLLNGSLDVQSDKEKGTSVLIEMPL